MECENDAIHPRFQLKPDIYRSGTVFKVVLNILTLTFVSWRQMFIQSHDISGFDALSSLTHFLTVRFIFLFHA